MNDYEITLIKDSFFRIKNAEQDYSEVFYDSLFSNTPSAEALFKGDMQLQKKKLKTTIALVVNGLERFNELREVIFNLGKRHVEYGVHPDDFPDVADALIQTFNIVLDDFRDDEEEAWSKAINIISGVMLEAWET